MIQNANDLARSPRHELVLDALERGIDAVHPWTVIPDTVSVEGDTLHICGTSYDLRTIDNVYVLGGGKPAGDAAKAIEDILGERITAGAVVTDRSDDDGRIVLYEATHPLPSSANREATNSILELADKLTDRDLAIVLLGGGGSAMLFAPVEQITVDHYRDVVDRLLEAGAPIDDLNTVRKHLSRVKGGLLARRLAPATTVGIVFSDVVGDRLDVIASGPTAPDPTMYAEAMAVLERYEIEVAPPIVDHLRSGIDGAIPETPSSGDPCFESVVNHIVANNRLALEAMAAAFDPSEYEPVILAMDIEGEAQEVGDALATMAGECRVRGEPSEPPVAVLSGGELTVTVSGNGTGGPNQEFVLSAVLGLDGSEDLVASMDTDGIDGTSDLAGAIMTASDVPDRAAVEDALSRNDAHSFCLEHGFGIETGATGTNVNDVRILLVEPEGEPAVTDT